MGRVYTDYDGKYYRVIFRDETGMSILSQQKKLPDAKKKEKYYALRYKQRHLLKPDKTVGGWEDYRKKRHLRKVS